MYIGICKITIRIPENQSLKGKRHRVKSLCDSIRSRFSVCIAEIDYHDQWQLAKLGVVQIGINSKVVDSVLNKIMDFVYERVGNFEVLDHQIDVISEN